MYEDGAEDTFCSGNMLCYTMNVDINIDTRVFNDAYRPFLDDETRTQIFFGGASSGKSLFLIGQRMIIDLLKGGRNYIAARNVATTLRTSIFNEAKKGIARFNAGRLFKIKESEMTITCVNGYQAILKGLDDVHKIKSITPEKGVITDILIEEAFETSYEDMKELKKGLRGKSSVPKRITFILNPLPRTNWIYKEYFAGRFSDDDRMYRDEHLLIFKTTYNDNRFLEDDDIYELENETNEYYYNVYTLGNWGVLGKVVFTNWRTDDLTAIRNEFDHYRNGLDFGFTNSPAALCRSSKRDTTFYITHEYYRHGVGNKTIADDILPIVGRDHVYCDSAEPKSIAELRGYNINAVPAIKGADSVLYGIQWLHQFDIVIHRELQNTINNFHLYQWKKNKDGEYLNVPVDKDNHIPDALRYSYSDEMRSTNPKVWFA